MNHFTLESVRILQLLIALQVAMAGCAESQRGPGVPAVPSNAEYVASSRGQVYYAVDCDAWRELSTGTLVWFESVADAEAAGYRASSVAGCGAGEASVANGECTVSSVTDGDTLVCRGGTRIRLLLIDAPEMDQGEFGRLARRQLLMLAPPGTRLRLEFDVERADRYGRTLAYLHAPDGRFLNEEMARSGYAVALTYPPNVKHVERVRAAVEEARRARLGLWKTSVFECPPVAHRAGRCGP